jgi:hypothetical protein
MPGVTLRLLKKNTTHMKKTIIFPLLLVLLASACKEVQFEVPQPEGRPNLKEFPKSVQGTYLSQDETPDTLWIYADRYITTETNELKTKRKEVFVADIVLREYQGYYFVNTKDDEKSSWQLGVATLSKTNELEFHSFSSADNEKMEKIAQAIGARKIFKKDSDEVDYYLARPDKKRLMEVIKSGLVKDPEVTFRKL